MKLLLTSNGLCNDSIRGALRGMVNKPTKELNMVFFVTGSWPVRGDKTWLVNDLRRAHDMGWKNFDVLDLAVMADWPKELWHKALQDADVVMFCGGHAQYLSYWLEKSGLLTELPKLLNDKVYVGISAGSMVAGKSLATSSLKLSQYAKLPANERKEPPPGQLGDKTMQLADVLFRPHFNSSSFPLVRKDFMQQFANDVKESVYLVDDETALRIEDGKVEVISEGEWHLLQPTHE
jgi:dipeptidase E